MPHPEPIVVIDAPTRIHIVTGFLGAGKTTLLRHLLQDGLHGERVAVLVNEFGDVGIDGSLLRRNGHQVVELDSGCVCCEIGADMLDTVSRMIRDYHPTRIMFELTGVAEPGSVLAALKDTNYLVGRLRVEPTVCVVDARAFGSLVRELEYQYYNQIQAAEVVLLNKVDGVDDATLALVEAAVREYNPNAMQVPCQNCAVDLAVVFDAVPIETPTGADGHEHGVHFDSVVVRDPETVLDRGRVERWLETLPGLYRAKGTVRCRDGAFFLSWTRGGCGWEPALPTDPTPSTVVFIGQGMQPEEIAPGLGACVPRAHRGISLGGPHREEAG